MYRSVQSPRDLPQILLEVWRRQGSKGNPPLRLPDEAVCELTAQQSEAEFDQQLHLLAWTAALRLISGDQVDYRS